MACGDISHGVGKAKTSRRGLRGVTGREDSETGYMALCHCCKKFGNSFFLGGGILFFFFLI